MSQEDFSLIIKEFGEDFGIPNAGLDKYGSWNFLVDDMVVQIEVDKEAKSASCTALLGQIAKPTEELYEALLRANFFFIETHGATLGVNSSTRLATLCQRIDLEGLDKKRFTEVMEKFVNVAAHWKKQIESSQEAKQNARTALGIQDLV
jgi:hypothetical protein